MAQYDLPVNHRKISIAQVGGGDTRMAKPRPRLVSVGHEVSGKQAKVTVALQLGGVEYDGVAQGAASTMGRLRLVATATLNAVERIIPETHSFALEDITAVKLGRETIVVTSIAILGNTSDETYAGCAIVKDDEREAIVRSVLDAVNRRLSFLTTA
jgi:hypothetical protein